MSRWIAVIAVDDLDATRARATAAGAHVTAWQPGSSKGLLVTSPSGIEIGVASLG